MTWQTLSDVLPDHTGDTKEARGTKSGRKRDKPEAGHGEPTADGDRKGDRRTGGGASEGWREIIGVSCKCLVPGPIGRNGSEGSEHCLSSGS
jgi:hypothetical protein